MSEPRRLRRGEGYGARDDEAPRTDCPREPRYGRHVLRSAKACGAARMDRSEGTKRKSRKAAPFRARDGGKPRVAQPPQRDMAMQYDFQSSTALCRRAFSMGLGLVGRADHRGPQGNRVKRFRWGEEERRSERAPPPEAGRGIWSARRRSPPQRLPLPTPTWAACAVCRAAPLLF